MTAVDSRTGAQELLVVLHCVRCDEVTAGRFFFEVLTVVDSHGFVLFDEGPVCDGCLGEAS